MFSDKFQTFVNVNVRPKDVTALQSEVYQTAGYGVEVISGGGDGTEIFFAGGDQDPFEAGRSAAVRPGELIIGQFARFGIRWANAGISATSGITREVRLRVYRDRGIARVCLLSGDLLKVERKLLKFNNHTLAGGNLAPGATHEIFLTTDYLPLPADHSIDPGLGVPFRGEDGFLEIILGASAASGTLTTAPLLLIYQKHRLQTVPGATSLFWTQRLTALPVAAGFPAAYDTSWQWSLMPVAINLPTAASPPIMNRFVCPPNGVRITIYNPSENIESAQWEAYVYHRGQ